MSNNCATLAVNRLCQKIKAVDNRINNIEQTCCPTATNLGNGLPVYVDGSSPNFLFNTLVAGNNITLTSGGGEILFDVDCCSLQNTLVIGNITGGNDIITSTGDQLVGDCGFLDLGAVAPSDGIQLFSNDAAAAGVNGCNMNLETGDGGIAGGNGGNFGVLTGIGSDFGSHGGDMTLETGTGGLSGRGGDITILSGDGAPGLGGNRGGNILLRSGTGSASNSGDITIDCLTGGRGGNINIRAGNSDGTGVQLGGAIEVTAGTASGNNAGADVVISGGGSSIVGTGNGGASTMRGGAAGNSGTGGTVSCFGGDSFNGDGGLALFEGGRADANDNLTGAELGGRVIIRGGRAGSGNTGDPSLGPSGGIDILSYAVSVPGGQAFGSGDVKVSTGSTNGVGGVVTSGDISLSTGNTTSVGGAQSGDISLITGNNFDDTSAGSMFFTLGSINNGAAGSTATTSAFNFQSGSENAVHFRAIQNTGPSLLPTGGAAAASFVVGTSPSDACGRVQITFSADPPINPNEGCIVTFHKSYTTAPIVLISSVGTPSHDMDLYLSAITPTTFTVLRRDITGTIGNLNGEFTYWVIGY